jgi:hypothetical protein
MSSRLYAVRTGSPAEEDELLRYLLAEGLVFGIFFQEF